MTTHNISLRSFIAASATALLVAVALIAGSIHIAQAQPSFYLLATPSAAATSTLTFLTSSGQATSSTMDAYAFGGKFGFDKNALVIEYVASSTSSSLNIRFQYSINGNDWADDNYSYPALSGTTSPMVSIQQFNNYQWSALSTATTTKIINVPTAARYVRAIFTQSGAAGGIWYTWAPSEQTS